MFRSSPRSLGWRLPSVLLIVGGVFAFAAPAGAADGATLGIQPADEATYFHNELLPGNETHRTAIVTNRSASVQNVQIYPADGLTTPQGGFSVRLRSDPRLQIAAWTRVSTTSLTLAPGAQAQVPFVLAVPPGTPPGDYTGGIVVQSEPRPGKSSQVGKATAVQLNLVERVAARIYLRVAGTARPALTLGALTNSRTGPGRTFQVSVTNTGNMRLQPQATLHVAGWPNSKTLTFSAVDTILPGEHAVVKAYWAAPPAVFWGKATALVRSEAGTADTAESLRVVPVVPAALAALLLLILGWALVRGIRFVRTARRVLRGQAPAPARTARTPRTRRANVVTAPVAARTAAGSPKHLRP